jgi:hypothetical protein
MVVVAMLNLKFVKMVSNSLDRGRKAVKTQRYDPIPMELI